MKQLYKNIIIFTFLVFFTNNANTQNSNDASSNNTPAQESSNVKTEVLFFENFVRLVFSGVDYSELKPVMQGENIYIDFTKPAEIKIVGYNQNNKFIKSYGFANDSKSIAFRLKNDSQKLRKFIADNGVGFDIFTKGSGSIAEEEIIKPSNAILMSKLPVDGVIEEKTSKDKKKEKAQNITSNLSLIYTYPPDLYGPPSIKQEYKIGADFIGPLASNFGENKIYELEKISAGNFFEPNFNYEENIFTIKILSNNIDDLGFSAFKSGKYGYLVFNTKKPIFMPQIIANELVSNFSEVKNKKFTIFKFKLKGKFEKYSNYKLIAYKDKTSWNVEVHEKDNKNIENFTNQFSFKASNEWGENKISISIKNASKPLKLYDETTLETLKIFTTTENGYGNNQKRDFVDLSIEQSAQGLVVREKSDNIIYEKDKENKNKLFISKHPNLILSEEILALGESISEDEKKLSKKAFSIFSEQSIFPFELALKALAEKEKKDDSSKIVKKVKSKNKDKKDENSNAALPKTDEKIDIVQDLVFQISNAKNSEKTVLQKKLADYYFSKAFYSEAKGIYEDIVTNDSSFKEIFKVRASLAATKFLTKKFDEAKEDFTQLYEESVNSFSANELKFWQWLSIYNYNKKNRILENLEDIDFLEGYTKFMKQYTEEVRFSMGLDYVRYLAEINKFDDSKTILDSVIYDGIPTQYENDVKIINGKYLASIGRYEEAMEIFSALINNFEDRKNRAIANFELTKLNLLLGKIDYKQAVEELLKVSVMWRDDFFEVDVLETAGNIYLNEKNYMGALEIWRSIVQNFPQTAESVYILGKMKDIFIDLYDTGSVYNLEPLEVLRIYFRFRELMPVGEVGDRITRKVANYFINTDMIDNAIEILKHQISFRSQGDSKAELVLWLSQIYIDDNKLEDANKILTLLDNEVLSEDMSREVRNRKALILAFNNNLFDAIDLVKDDFSDSAENVRIEVFKRRENWFGIQDKIEPRLQTYIDSFPEPLRKDEIKNIITLAIAYASQNQNEKLKKLEQDFISRLDNEDDIKVFTFLTSGLNKLDYKDFERTSELEKIQSFLNEYSYLPSKKWLTVANLLEDKVSKLEGLPYDQLTLEDRSNVVALALAYSYLTREGTERVILESKKKYSNLARIFKDVKVDRDTIHVFKMLDNRADPKELDAVFEGKIRLADIEKFVAYYTNANKFSQLNIMIREKFNN